MPEQPSSDQLQGYDQVATMFTPEGRLRQVEYASLTAKRGSPTLAMVCTDGVLIIVHKRIHNDLRISRKGQKIIPLDKHACLGISGIISDGRALAETAQTFALQHRLSFDGGADIKSIVEYICSQKQQYTQFDGARPYGVSMLVIGIDEIGPKLYQTETSGIFTGYKATAIGEHDVELKAALKERYTESVTVKEGLSFAMDLLKNVMKDSFDPEMIEGAYICDKDKEFSYLEGDEIVEAAKSLETI